MKNNPSNPADINTGEVRHISPKSFEKARVLGVQALPNGLHSATIKLYEDGSQTTAPVLTPAFGDISLPTKGSDVMVLFGENDEQIVIGSWYPVDRLFRGEIDVPDYNVGDRIIGNDTDSFIKIRTDGTIDIETQGSKPLNTDHQSMSVYLSGGQTIAGNTEERINFNTVSHNNEGLYDTNAYEATIISGGEHEIKATVEIDNAGQNNTYAIRVYRNGNVEKRSFRQSVINNKLTLRVSTNEIFDKGDVIYITLENKSASNRTINGGSIGTEFDLRRVGPDK